MVLIDFFYEHQDAIVTLNFIRFFKSRKRPVKRLMGDAQFTGQCLKACPYGVLTVSTLGVDEMQHTVSDGLHA